jgi:hypothetical protein
LIYRMHLPNVGIVATEHQLAGSYLRDQMTQSLGREDQGIEIELVQILP